MKVQSDASCDGEMVRSWFAEFLRDSKREKTMHAVRNQDERASRRLCSSGPQVAGRAEETFDLRGTFTFQTFVLHRQPQTFLSSSVTFFSPSLRLFLYFGFPIITLSISGHGNDKTVVYHSYNKFLQIQNMSSYELIKHHLQSKGAFWRQTNKISIDFHLLRANFISMDS